MENIKHVALIINRMDDLWQGTRSALGLAVANYYAYLFLLDVPVEATDELLENLEWLEDMECECFSNIRENEQHGFGYLPTDTIARKLKQMDIVVPFGNRSEAPRGRMPINWMLQAA
jgi:hypothetical protein